MGWAASEKEAVNMKEREIVCSKYEQVKEYVVS